MKKLILKLLLTGILLNAGLTACNGHSSCWMQAMAGGSQYCETQAEK